MNAPYKTLGLSENATEEQVRKAYRKLAMKHHPDRGGDTAKFQSIQTAYDEIEKAGFRHIPPPRPSPQPGRSPGHDSSFWAPPNPPQSPGGTWRDKDDIGNIFEEMKKANAQAPNGSGYSGGYQGGATSAEKVAMVTLREAFSGFNMVIPRKVRGILQQDNVNIQPGVPDGYRDTYKTSSGNFETIIVRIDAGRFRLRNLSDQSNLFSAGLSAGDLEMDVELDALDLIVGTWLKTEDFLGEKLDVRVPAGFNPLHRLKIAGKGYYGWDPVSGIRMQRQNLYIKVQPVWKALKDHDPAKLAAVVKMLGEQNAENGAA